MERPAHDRGCRDHHDSAARAHSLGPHRPRAQRPHPQSRPTARSASSTANCPGSTSTTACVEEAENPRHPLLERLRFVSISAVQPRRVLFGPRRRPDRPGQGRRHRGLAGRPHPGAAAGRDRAARRRACWPSSSASGASCATPLRDAGIESCEAAQLSDDDRAWLDAWFMERVFPVLTPLAIDPAHPFPFIPNMGLVMALLLAARRRRPRRCAR